MALDCLSSSCVFSEVHEYLIELDPINRYDDGSSSSSSSSSSNCCGCMCAQIDHVNLYDTFLL